MEWILGLKGKLKDRLKNKTFLEKITIRGSATEKLLKELDSWNIFKDAKELAKRLKEGDELRARSKDELKSEKNVKEEIIENPKEIAELCTNGEYLLVGKMQAVVEKVKKIADKAPRTSYLKKQEFTEDLELCQNRLNELEAYYNGMWENLKSAVEAKKRPDVEKIQNKITNLQAIPSSDMKFVNNMEKSQGNKLSKILIENNDLIENNEKKKEEKKNKKKSKDT
jgi:hypothetical protein